jgi:hypothetical protein
VSSKNYSYSGKQLTFIIALMSFAFAVPSAAVPQAAAVIRIEFPSGDLPGEPLYAKEAGIFERAGLDASQQLNSRRCRRS